MNKLLLLLLLLLVVVVLFLLLLLHEFVTEVNSKWVSVNNIIEP